MPHLLALLQCARRRAWDTWEKSVEKRAPPRLAARRGSSRGSAGRSPSGRYLRRVNPLRWPSETKPHSAAATHRTHDTERGADVAGIEAAAMAAHHSALAHDRHF